MGGAVGTGLGRRWERPSPSLAVKVEGEAGLVTPSPTEWHRQDCRCCTYWPRGGTFESLERRSLRGRVPQIGTPSALAPMGSREEPASPDSQIGGGDNGADGNRRRGTPLRRPGTIGDPKEPRLKRLGEERGGGCLKIWASPLQFPSSSSAETPMSCKKRRKTAEEGSEIKSPRGLSSNSRFRRPPRPMEGRGSRFFPDYQIGGNGDGPHGDGQRTRETGRGDFPPPNATIGGSKEPRLRPMGARRGVVGLKKRVPPLEFPSSSSAETPMSCKKATGKDGKRLGEHVFPSKPTPNSRFHRLPWPMERIGAGSPNRRTGSRGQISLAKRPTEGADLRRGPPSRVLPLRLLAIPPDRRTRRRAGGDGLGSSIGHRSLGSAPIENPRPYLDSGRTCRVAWAGPTLRGTRSLRAARGARRWARGVQ